MAQNMLVFEVFSPLFPYKCIYMSQDLFRFFSLLILYITCIMCKLNILF